MPNETIEPKRLLKNNFIIIGGALMVILVLFIPLPALLLDILWVLNLIFALLIFLITLHSKKSKGFLFLPALF